jgi:hypothetical protein
MVAKLTLDWSMSRSADPAISSISSRPATRIALRLRARAKSRAGTLLRIAGARGMGGIRIVRAPPTLAGRAPEVGGGELKSGSAHIMAALAPFEVGATPASFGLSSASYNPLEGAEFYRQVISVL